MKSRNKKEELILTKNYKLFLNCKLGNGAFGEIYKGEEISTHKKIAIKCETVQENKSSQLKSEIEILRYLRGIPGIPKLYLYIFSKTHNFMLFELLGPNIDELFHFCNKKFSLPTVLSLGLQMLNRIEKIHSLHIIHRDIKPENFLVGKKDKISTIYLCDFGLAKRFRDKTTGNHIPYNNKKHFVGTPSFASVYTHLGCEQSRRDDLESLAYILIYLGTGKLPWRGLKAKGKDEKYSKILSIKMNVKKEELLNGLPDEFMEFLQTVRNLQFEEKPDYEYLKELLRKMNESDVELENIKMDYISLFEKNKINKKIIKSEYINDNYLNNGESKKATKSNSNENNDKNVNK